MRTRVRSEPHNRGDDATTENDSKPALRKTAMPITTKLLTTALDRSIPLHQQLRRHLLIDLLLNTDESINDIIAVVNWIMTQPAD